MMMQLKTIIAATAVVATLAFAAGNWHVNTSGAKVTFNVKGPFGTVNGSFTGLKATIKFNEKDLGGSAVSASIDAKTVSTGNGLRNRDLRKKEIWLNTDKFPLISFHSKKIEKDAKGYKALGELTIKGITKPAIITFTFTPKGSEGVFKGQMEVKREEFNVGKKGGSVGDVITIHLEVPVKK